MRYFKIICVVALMSCALSLANAYTLNTNGGNGYLTGDDSSFVLTGSNDWSGNENFTTYTGTMSGDGSITFDWSYWTDDEPGYDGGGYVLNGAYTFLSYGYSPFSGTVTVNYFNGDNFGWFVATTDNWFGAGHLGIDTVPEPVTILLLGLGLMGLVGMRRKLQE